MTETLIQLALALGGTVVFLVLLLVYGASRQRTQDERYRDDDTDWDAR